MRTIVLSVIVLLVLGAPVAQAELYTDLFAGLNLSSLIGDSAHGGEALNRPTAMNPLYGLRLGGWHDYLGAELELHHAHPDIRQNTWTNGPGGARSPFTGRSLSVNTIALHALVRYPDHRLEPFLGAGLGYYTANLGADYCGNGFCNPSSPYADFATKATALGPSLKAGVAWHIYDWCCVFTSSLAVVLTYQVQQAMFTFSGRPTTNGDGGVQERLDYRLQSVNVGLRYSW